MGVVVGIYRLALAAITFLALFWAPSTGVTFDLEDYVYFTNQSNLLLAVVMLWGGIAVLARRTEPAALAVRRGDALHPHHRAGLLPDPRPGARPARRSSRSA